jgi:hypothetical protein
LNTKTLPKHNGEKRERRTPPERAAPLRPAPPRSIRSSFPQLHWTHCHAPTRRRGDALACVPHDGKTPARPARTPSAGHYPWKSVPLPGRAVSGQDSQVFAMRLLKCGRCDRCGSLPPAQHREASLWTTYTAEARAARKRAQAA